MIFNHPELGQCETLKPSAKYAIFRVMDTKQAFRCSFQQLEEYREQYEVRRVKVIEPIPEETDAQVELWLEDN